MSVSLVANQDEQVQGFIAGGNANLSTFLTVVPPRRQPKPSTR